MTYATTTALANEVKRAKAAEAALQAQVDALVAAAQAPAPIPSLVTRAFPATGTPAQLLALMNDLTIDVIEMAAGTYKAWQLYARVNRSSRPLRVQPAPNAAVVFDGTGRPDGANGAFYFGANEGLPGTPTSATSFITFDAAGTGGSFAAQNYTIGSTGIVVTGWVDHLTFNGLHILNCTGTVANQSHGLYVESDGTHRSKEITADDWVFDGPASRLMDPLQTYHAPNADGIHARRWKVSNGWRAAYLWADPSGVDIDGWTITNCAATFDDSAETARGTIRNCTATGSGPLAKGSGYWTGADILDGGGNRWA